MYSPWQKPTAINQKLRPKNKEKEREEVQQNMPRTTIYHLPQQQPQGAHLATMHFGFVFGFWPAIRAKLYHRERDEGS